MAEIRETTMASHTSGRGGNDTGKAADRVKASAGGTRSAAEAGEPTKRHAADTGDEAADVAGDKSDGMREAASRSARAAQEKLHDAVDYVRDTDPRQMGGDLMNRAATYPLASVLIVSALVIGGGYLVATMMRDEGVDREVTGGRRPRGLSSVTSAFGPKGHETLAKIRDAAVSFAMAKAVDTAEQIFPGFREHFDRG
jgi:hypothetical protein